MSSPGYLRRACAALVARPWSCLGGLLAAVFSVAVVYAFTVEPSLAPVTEVASGNPPYRPELDARTAIARGQARAAENGKMLMVTFGANWCPDCLRLYSNLQATETHAYLDDHFELVTIDVGDARSTAAVQRALGLNVHVIPAALFYESNGALVGDTLGGELKSSRHFSSRDIRDFLREVVDYHRIVSPDQRQ